MHTVKLHIETPEETESVAEKIGSHLRGGEVIELVSDLGGGKTTFVRGLARGMGSKDRVASPTFTISKVYKAEDKELHHFDFYRIQEAGLMGDELDEILGDPQIVVVVEWGGVMKDVLPNDRLTITIHKTPTDTRDFTLEAPDDLSYLLESIQ